MWTYDPASLLSPSIKWMFDEGNVSDLSSRVCARFVQENGATDRETCAIKHAVEITKPFKEGFVSI